MAQNSSPKPVSLLGDTIAKEDVLDYSAYRDALVSIIEGLGTETSLTIAVFGDWGSGKTTLLSMVREEIAKRQIQSIWVNVWQFGNEEDVWTAFLQSILLKVKKEIPWFRRLLFNVGLLKRRIKWDEVNKKIPELLIRVAVVIVPLYISLQYLSTAEQASQTKAATVAAGAGTIGSALLGWFLLVQPYVHAIRKRVKINLKSLMKSSELKERVSLLDQFKTYFEDMIVSLVGERGRLVIVVDDLDRCQPSRIVQVLDSIKLFLDIPRCIYLIGLDREIIEQAVKSKFARYKQPDKEAREYLEKIVGLPFDLPPLSGQQMEVLVKSLNANLPDAENSTQVFALGQQPNPRKVKRTINIFLLLWALAQGRKELKDLIKPTRLAKIVVIQHSYRDLYILLTLSPGSLGELELYFRESEKAKSDDISGLPTHLQSFASDSNLRKLLTLHTPKDAATDDANFTVLQDDKYIPLSEEDVRVYIQLARSITRDRANNRVADYDPSFIFVNREKELSVFRDVLSGKRREQVIFLSGESGMGKTAILYQYEKICQEQRIPALIERQSLFTATTADVERIVMGIYDWLYHSPTGNLVRDLKRYTANTRTVIMFDRYEMLSEVVKRWIHDVFLRPIYRQELPNMIVVIAGRDVPTFENLDKIELRLAPLSRESVAEYLRQIGLEVNEDILKYTSDRTKGIPISVAQVAAQMKRISEWA